MNGLDLPLHNHTYKQTWCGGVQDMNITYQQVLDRVSISSSKLNANVFMKYYTLLTMHK